VQRHTFNLVPELPRSAIALVILGAHVAILHAALTLAPSASSRGSDQPVTARFIDAVQPERRWQPPSAVPVTPPVYVQELVVPEVEVHLDEPDVPSQMTARAITASSVPAPLVGDAPKLISTVEYVREPAPRYPPQSRRLGEQGLVVLRVLIDEKGQACSIEIESSSGHVRLDHAAKDAVARAAFRPYVEDGAPRRALVLIPIEFSLNSGTV
jgi:periplasmic protein TonB